ncbi:MAG: threonine/serine dehydratase [Pseudomonadota bacterium]
MTVSIDDIKAAATRIAPEAVRTPLLRNAFLDADLGAQVFVKPENLQRTGSFKFRGAYNKLSQLSDDEKKSGVVAWSSGNHAQGVAAAAGLLGVKATIVMPADAPALKVKNTEAYGAEIRFYDRATENREDIARALVAERGAVLVPSYDDLDIVAGQGVAGLEIADDLKGVRASADLLLCCCGGGGLVAGVATAMAALSPETKVYAVEPTGFDDTARSLSAGERLSNPSSSGSICDALLAPTPGALTFPINKTLLSGGLVVTEDEVLKAMRYAFEKLKLVVEPGGAVALAAALAGKIDVSGKTIVLVLSGGNVDAELFARALA